MITRKKRVWFAICVADEGYEDLDVWKVYQVLPDRRAAELGCIRVIDESGEDYLYPANLLVAVNFSKVVRTRLPRFLLTMNRNAGLPSRPYCHTLK